MTDPGEPKPPSGYDPADPLKDPSELVKPPTGSDPKSPPTPVNVATIRPIVRETWRQGHGIVATFTDLDSIRLEDKEADSAAEATLVLIGDALKDIKNLPAILAVISLILLEVSVAQRALTENKQKHPNGRRRRPIRRAETEEDYEPEERSGPPPGALAEAHDDLMGVPRGARGADDGPG